MCDIVKFYRTYKVFCHSSLHLLLLLQQKIIFYISFKFKIFDYTVAYFLH